ncbi:MAG: CGNR zinc finger domain-containing protein [Waterburya sp.]
MNTHQNWTQLKRVGGRLCLDFINTVDRDRAGFLKEWFTDAIALINWGQQVQLLTPQQADHLRQQVQQQPELAQRLFEQAIKLREVLYRIFSAVSAKKAPVPSDLTHLNDWLTAAYSHSQLIWDGTRFIRIQANLERLESILWQVVRSAEELLLDSMLDRVRECAGKDCGWIFLDTSRNRSRRWCDMEDCGNRAKARRHYERRK